jgi:transglutaminase-like putative cysteine protease
MIGSTPESPSQLLPPSKFFGSLPTNITRTPASADPDTAVAQTVVLMNGAIERAVESPIIQRCAARPGSSPAIAAEHAFWFAKSHVKFVNDDKLLRIALGIGTPEEFLIEPARLITMPRPRGDCDDFTMLVCSLLACSGIPYQIETVAADPRVPGIYSHVYCSAILSERVPLDASHGPYPGWEVPAGRVTRRQIWPGGYAFV